MDRYYETMRVHLHTERMGNDLCITVCGGDCPHIGSVAIAEPRESLTGDGTLSATVSTFNFVGHKDDAVANAIAHAVAANLGCRAVVLCGLHYDSVCSELFSQVQALTMEMIEDISRTQQ